MGTRGAYGIRKNGVDKIAYNHFDSYPQGLGGSILNFISSMNENELKKCYDLMEMVDESSVPTKEQIDYCKENGYADMAVSTGEDTDWYCLTRYLQGNFDELKNITKKGKKIYLIDSKDFIKDSLFCEHAYIINLDDNVLEYYKGFQQTPDPNNRYGQKDERGYYPCKMLKTFPLDELYGIKDKEISNIVNKMDNAEYEVNADVIKATFNENPEYKNVLSDDDATLINGRKIIFMYDTIKDAGIAEARKAGILQDNIISYFDYIKYIKELESKGECVVLGDRVAMLKQ